MCPFGVSVTENIKGCFGNTYNLLLECYCRQSASLDRRTEPRVGERVPYVIVYGSPGLPLIQLAHRSVYVLL